MADIKDLIKELKREAQNTRWKSPHSIKSVKETLVSLNKETAADKENKSELKASNDAQLQMLTSISTTLEKMYDKANAPQNAQSDNSSRIFGGLGLAAMAKAAGTGLLAGAAGIAAMGVAISAFFGGIVAGDKLLGVATDWLNTDFNFNNIKKAAAGFSSIISEMDANDFLVLGGIMGASAIGGVKAAMGLGSMGAAISSFFVGLLAGETVLAGMDWLGVNFNFDSIKKAAKGFTSIIQELDTKGIVVLGTILAGGALAGFMSKKPTDVAVGMTSLGAGISGFFIGLATGDKALGWMNTDYSNINKAMKNFSDGIGGLSGEAQTALAAMIGAGGIIGILAGKGKSFDMAAGMTSMGAGIAGFFAGLGGGEKLLSMLKVDGSKLATFMKNVAEGIGAFSGDKMIALGALLAGGALFGTFGGPVAAGAAALGMSAIGAGLGGFMAGLGLGEAAIKFMGTDGSTLKKFLQNMAGGLQPLGELDGSNLKSLAGGLYAIGPAIAAFAGGEGIGKLLDMAGDAWDKVTSFFGNDDKKIIKPEDSPMSRLIRGMVVSLKPLESLDINSLSNFTVMSDAISTLSDGVDKIADLDTSDFNEKLLFIASSLIGAAKKFQRVSDLYSGMTLNVVPQISGNIDTVELAAMQGMGDLDVSYNPAGSMNGVASNIINDPEVLAAQRQAAIQQIVIANEGQSGGGSISNTNSNITYITNKQHEMETNPFAFE